MRRKVRRTQPAKTRPYHGQPQQVRAGIAPGDLLAQLLVLTLVSFQHLLTVACHRGIFTAQSLNLALQLRNLASLRFDALETLILRIDLTLVDGHPFLIDALAVHQGIG